MKAFLNEHETAGNLEIFRRTGMPMRRAKMPVFDILGTDGIGLKELKSVAQTFMVARG